jgi:hypothetical protein
MKKLLLMALASLVFASALSAASTVNPVNRFAYGANIGWMDWRGDGANGAVIGAYVCSGSIYGANVGWIHLGDGTPADGVRYQNIAGDYGVNHDGLGNLRGHAYGANIGWLTFTNQGTDGALYEGPKVDLVSGRLSGFVWSANCGWISLNNSFAFVQTDSLYYGPDSDGDGLPDPWELQYAANLGVLTGSADTDGDGSSNAEEFGAGTDPLNGGSNLRITAVFKANPVAPTRLFWTSSPTRQYRVHSSTTVTAPLPWADAGLGVVTPSPGLTTSRDVPPTADPYQFFLIEALLPLSP